MFNGGHPEASYQRSEFDDGEPDIIITLTIDDLHLRSPAIESMHACISEGSTKGCNRQVFR